MSYVITEEDHATLGHVQTLAELLATGMAHTARSAEVIYPHQVEAAAACMAQLVAMVRTRAREASELDD